MVCDATVVKVMDGLMAIVVVVNVVVDIVDCDTMLMSAEETASGALHHVVRALVVSIWHHAKHNHLHMPPTITTCTDTTITAANHLNRHNHQHPPPHDSQTHTTSTPLPHDTLDTHHQHTPATARYA